MVKWCFSGCSYSHLRVPKSYPEVCYRLQRHGGCTFFGLLDRPMVLNSVDISTNVHGYGTQNALSFVFSKVFSVEKMCLLVHDFSIYHGTCDLCTSTRSDSLCVSCLTYYSCSSFKNLVRTSTSLPSTKFKY